MGWNVAIAVVVIWGLQWTFYHTALGRSFRAVSDNQDIAQLMGLDKAHVFGLAMALALAVTALFAVVMFAVASMTVRRSVG